MYFKIFRGLGLLSVTSEKYVHKVLVNCLVKLAQEKKCGLVN